MCMLNPTPVSVPVDATALLQFASAPRRPPPPEPPLWFSALTVWQCQQMRAPWQLKESVTQHRGIPGQNQGNNSGSSSRQS